LRKYFIKIISMFIVFLLSIQALAANVESFGLNIPNIQNLSPSEQSGPTSGASLVLESPIDTKSYILGPGDILAIHIIVGDAEFSVDRSLAIGADGNAFFPNIGSIYLSGLSLDQAKIKIDSKIRSAYRESYKLYVLLNQPKMVKIYLSGMVKNPGPLAVYDHARMSEVLSQAGGVASGASNRYVYIKRKNIDGKEEMLKADLFAAYRSHDLSKDIRIQAGDVIEVPDSNNVLISRDKTDLQNDKLLFEGRETFVYVYGEVAKSGRFEYVAGKKLSDYISYAGGPTAKALLGSVSLTRQLDGKPQKYNINASDVLYNGNSRNDVEIFGGDVISVPGNFFYVSDFTSFANTILLALTLYNTVKR